MHSAFLAKLASAVVIPFIGLLHLAGYYNIQKPQPLRDYSLDIAHLTQSVNDLGAKLGGQSQNLGATNAIPTSVALFSTSLQSAITSTQTTMTLVSATYNNGASTLASSTYDFIIDEGTVTQEFISADCTATSCTNMSRGLDWVTGTSSVTSLKFAHRRGASVKITDAPLLLKLTSLAAGSMGYPQSITYASSVASTSFSTPYTIVDKDYVDGAAFSGAGVIDATTAARGVSTLATGLQAASSTATLSSHPLVLPASLATSTYNSSGSLQVLVTQNNNKIDGNFISTTTLGARLTLSNGLLSGTTTISSPASTTDSSGQQIMWALVASSTASANQATLSVTGIPPRKLLKLYVETGNTSSTFDYMTFNGDSGSNYSENATTTANNGDSHFSYAYNSGNVASTTAEISIWDGGTKIKRMNSIGSTWSGSSAASVAPPFMVGGIWATTTAQYISSLTITPNTGNIVAGSSVYVYASSF